MQEGLRIPKGLSKKDIAELKKLLSVHKFTPEELRLFINLYKMLENTTPTRVAATVALELFNEIRLRYLKYLSEEYPKDTAFRNIVKIGEEITEKRWNAKEGKYERVIKKEYESLVNKIRSNKSYYNKYRSPSLR